MKILVQDKNQIINVNNIVLYSDEYAKNQPLLKGYKVTYRLCTEKKDEVIELGSYSSRKRTQEILTEIIKNKESYYIMPEK